MNLLLIHILWPLSPPKGNNPYQPVVRVEKRAYLINVISLSLEEANNGIYFTFLSSYSFFLT